MLPVLILCGGLGTRLYPITKTIPKSLISINGKIFISYQLELLKRKGVSDVVLCVGKFGSMIEKYVGDGSQWGLHVRYSYEDDGNLLGTGGAVKNALKMLPDEFMITYGDSYLGVDYNDVTSKFYQEEKPMLITVYKNDNIGDISNILYKDGKIIRYSKQKPTKNMRHIDYGLLVVKKNIFEYCLDRFDLSQLMFEMVNKGKVSAYETHVPFFEIGSEEGLKQFKNKVQNVEWNSFMNSCLFSGVVNSHKNRCF